MVIGRTSVAQVMGDVRIPGVWEHVGELRRKLPEGYRLTSRWLDMPDGSRVEYFAKPPDGEFVPTFGRSCRELPTCEERQRIEDYTVNFCLSMPVGNREAAVRLMTAVSAILRAGGAGVFVDNSGVSHGASAWLALSHIENRETGPTRAFTSKVRSKGDIFSVGMHVLGCRDVVLTASNRDSESESEKRDVERMLCYLAREDATDDKVGVPDDSDLQKFRFVDDNRQLAPSHSTLYNPNRRWRLIPR